MTTLYPSWEITQKTGQPHSLIRVRNLQTALPIGRDAWGRPGKLQPILISVSVSLKEHFKSASEEDKVTGSTIHYGVLSKAILNICSRYVAEFSHMSSLQQFLHILIGGLTLPTSGASEVLPESLLKSLEIKVLLPKASLLGSGISLTNTIPFVISTKMSSPRSSVLGIHDLRISTLIGVNANERLARQVVVTNVRLDPWGLERDVYCELEEIVVKTIEESSFQTLEALATHLGHRIIRYFLVPLYEIEDSLTYYPRIRISLEKPTAVMFADAPMVEILMDEDPGSAISVTERGVEKVRRPPFPLEVRLDEWIKASERGSGEGKDEVKE